MSSTSGAEWPVDVGEVRLWPMAGEDGPRLQELFDGLADFRTPFGEPGSADAVSTFLALPEGRDYRAKLLLGIWRDDDLVGALDVIMGYPTTAEWTVGLLVVADQHRRRRIGTTVVRWTERAAADRGADTLRIVLREVNEAGLGFAGSQGYEREPEPCPDPGHVVVARTLR